MTKMDLELEYYVIEGDVWGVVLVQGGRGGGGGDQQPSVYYEVFEVITWTSSVHQ